HAQKPANLVSELRERAVVDNVLVAPRARFHGLSIRAPASHRKTITSASLAGSASAAETSPGPLLEPARGGWRPPTPRRRRLQRVARCLDPRSVQGRPQRAGLYADAPPVCHPTTRCPTSPRSSGSPISDSCPSCAGRIPPVSWTSSRTRTCYQRTSGSFCSAATRTLIHHPREATWLTRGSDESCLGCAGLTPTAP